MSPRASKPKPPPEPDALVRQQAGRYRSGDERFTVRQDGGEWFVTDSQQTNEFGLEMVLGPFPTVARAREAMASQRERPAGAEPGAAVRSIAAARAKRPASASKAAPNSAEQATDTKAPNAERARTSSQSRTAEHKPPTKPASRPTDESPRPAPAVPAVPALQYLPAPWEGTGDERDQVARTVRTINDAWVSGRPDQMRDALDADVVFVQPGFKARETGRDRAIDSYREFVAAATLRRYAESELTIDLSGHTAVASYRWQIAYSMDGKGHDEKGRDLLVFDRTGTRWKLVWRLLLPD